MFTVQELMVASELEMGLPIILWENGGLKQIQDDMRSRSIPLVGVEGANPDFIKLAESMNCDGIEVKSVEHASDLVREGWEKTRPTLIMVRENADYWNRN